MVEWNNQLYVNYRIQYLYIIIEIGEFGLRVRFIKQSSVCFRVYRSCRYACQILLYANILYYAGNYFSERNETQLIFTSNCVDFHFFQ